MRTILTAVVTILIASLATGTFAQSKPVPKTLFYDSDGTGAAAAVLFATVNPGTALTNLDFVGYS